MIDYSNSGGMVADATPTSPPSAPPTKPVQQAKPFAAPSKQVAPPPPVAPAKGSVLPPPPVPVVSPVPAAAPTTPAQVPIPTHEQLGVPNPNKVSYDAFANMVHGPLPSIQEAVDSWKTPEMQSAATNLHHALMANFYQAMSGDSNSLSLFFQSNPYAYMLGQSMDNISKIMAEKARKDGNDDPLVSQYATPSIIMDTAAMLQGRANLSIGQPYGAPAEIQEYHAQTLQPYLDGLTQKGLNRVSGYIFSQALAINKENPQLISAYAQDKGARASLQNASTQQQTLQFSKDKWAQQEREYVASQSAANRASAEHSLASAKLLNEQAGQVAPSADWENRYKAALIRLTNAQAQDVPDRTYLLTLQAEDQKNQLTLDALNGVAASYYNQMTAMDTYIAQNTLHGEHMVFATEDQVKKGLAKSTEEKVPDTILQGWMAQRKEYSDKYDAEVKRANKIRDSILDNSKNASPEFQIRKMSAWLSASIKTGKDTPDIAKDVISGQAGQNAKALYFPEIPMAWNPQKNVFESVSNVEAMPKAQQEILNRQMYQEPFLSAIRAMQPMSYPEWLQYVAAVKKQDSNSTLSGAHYRHYLIMFNYAKQTDHLIQTARAAQSHRQALMNYATDEMLDAPQVDINPKLPSTRPNTQKGSK